MYSNTFIWRKIEPYLVTSHSLSSSGEFIFQQRMLEAVKLFLVILKSTFQVRFLNESITMITNDDYVSNS